MPLSVESRSLSKREFDAVSHAVLLKVKGYRFFEGMDYPGRRQASYFLRPISVADTAIDPLTDHRVDCYAHLDKSTDEIHFVTVVPDQIPEELREIYALRKTIETDYTIRRKVHYPSLIAEHEALMYFAEKNPHNTGIVNSYIESRMQDILNLFNYYSKRFGIHFDKFRQEEINEANAIYLLLEEASVGKLLPVNSILELQRLETIGIEQYFRKRTPVVRVKEQVMAK